MSIRFCLPLLAAAFALAGCSGPRLAPNTGRTTYLDTLYKYGVAERDLRLEVRGALFGPDAQPALEKTVEAAVTGAGLLQPPPRPRLHPDSSALDNYRLVVSFSGSVPLMAQDLCDGRAPQSQASTGSETTAIMAFCVSGRAASEATGWIIPTGPEDPHLTDLLRRMALEVFRPDDTLQGSGGTTQ